MIDWDRLVLGPVMGVFGEEVIFLPRSGSPVTIPDAVFDEEAAEVQIGQDGQPVTLRKPVLGIRAARLPFEPKQSDRVLITRTGGSYVVKTVEPDGHGSIRMDLMQASR